MAIELFKHARLNRDLPDEGLRAGDIVVPLDFLSAPDGELGCTIEVFNAVGDTILVTAIALSAVEPLTANDIPQVRQRAAG